MSLKDYLNALQALVAATPFVTATSLSYEERPPSAWLIKGSILFADGSQLDVKEFLITQPALRVIKWGIGTIEKVQPRQITREDKQQERTSSTLDLGKRLEDWIELNPSHLANNLMIIGCQVTTFSGGKIDLLCINDTGDLVIVELKRNKTPREVTAQALEYASWVTDFPSDRVRGIADRYLGKRGPFRVFTNTEEIDRFLSGLVPTWET